jgi:hypothetical protein
MTYEQFWKEVERKSVRKETICRIFNLPNPHPWPDNEPIPDYINKE